jgi:hypothetical protein
VTSTDIFSGRRNIVGTYRVHKSELKGDTAVSFFGGVKNWTKIVNTR